MPFSTTFICLNPNRIRLLDKWIPVEWWLALRRNPGKIRFLALEVATAWEGTKKKRPTQGALHPAAESISRSKKGIPIE